MANAPDRDWYLPQWMTYLGKRQADIVRDLGWNKSRASMVFNGAQPYSRTLVNELSTWLGIRPYELLMPPAEAQALKRFRESAYAIVAETPQEFSRDDSGKSPTAVGDKRVA